MAIQIDEKLLSQRAKEALRNAKSKSQLLRDALEAYVRIEPAKMLNEDIEIRRDIKDIKELLIKLTDTQSQFAAANEFIATAEGSKEIALSVFDKVVENEQPLNKDKLVENKEDKKTTSEEIKLHNNDIDEAKKREIEKMLEASLTIYDFEEDE